MTKIANIEELFLLTQNKLVGEHRAVSITFANRSHIYSGNDVIGNCLQEWLPDWFTFLGINIRAGGHTQKFPDFVADFDGVSHDIEVKAWNINNAPSFDLANFYSFLESTFSEPGKLNAHYFILGY
ncbi:NgoBV family restriction endonuclease [Canibacter sp. lx-45]|uniref:NgoBV family restriction endonuclease n=1 Tax=Canibacter zhuwentaonis TaxID=2837491 RepID=UPI001BDCB931|nr:NgoBV family restriction endonuclease [Canibacter zhuwentaonis]